MRSLPIGKTPPVLHQKGEMKFNVTGKSLEKNCVSCRRPAYSTNIH